MALIKAEAMFKIFPAKVVHKQKVKLRPNEHHFENEGEKPYIKYTCQICEKLFKRNGGEGVKLTTSELQIIERLLSNCLNADFDPDVDELLHKVRKEINERNHQFNRTMEWCKSMEQLPLMKDLKQ